MSTIPSEETLLLTLDRLWKLLGALSRRPEIFEILRAQGLSNDEYQRGWDLVLTANGYAHPSSAAPAPASADESRRALLALDQSDERLFRRVRAVLQGDYPAQLASLLAGGLSAEPGAAAVASIQTLLDRVEALSYGSPEDRAALAKLEQRGLSPEERARLRGLLKAAMTAPPVPDPVPAIDPSVRQEALRKAYFWFHEWAALARDSISRGDYLIALGLRSRASRETPDKEPPPPTA